MQIIFSNNVTFGARIKNNNRMNDSTLIHLIVFPQTTNWNRFSEARTGICSQVKPD